jgi:hypothetical protein
MAKKKDYSKYMLGGLAIGGLYLMTRGSVLGPTFPARHASSAADAGVTPGLFYYISESTEWNDYQIMQPALAPEIPQIIIPYTYNETVTYLMARGMLQPAAESEAVKIIQQGYPSVVTRLASLYDSPNRTIGDRREIYAHLTPLYNVMGTPNDQRVPSPGATVATTTPTAESVQGMAVKHGVAGHYHPGGMQGAHQTTNRAGNRMARSISGMKAWTRDHAKQVYEQRQLSATREMTLENMKAGMDINLYKPVNTLEVFSEAPQYGMQQADNVGNALVKTRDSMRRLL